MIPFIMDETQTLADLVADSSNGLGRLAECKICNVKEVLNGEYVATVEVPLTAQHSDLLHRGGILKLLPNKEDAPQLFRIARIKETPSAVICECEHISYDLNKSVVALQGNTILKMENLLYLLNDQFTYARIYPAGTFTATSDIDPNTAINRTYNRPLTPRELLLGEYGIVAMRGWQMKWDNDTYAILNRRGEDKREKVIVAYGKNVLDCAQETDIANVYDGVMGFVYLENKWPNAINGDVVPFTPGATPQFIYMLDLSENAKNMASAPTAAQVTTWTNSWLANQTNIGTPKVSLTVEMADIYGTSQYEAYEELETVHLGDTITVYIDVLGIEVEATVTELEFDALTESIESITLGNYKPSLANTLYGMVMNNRNAINDTKVQYSEVATSGSNGLMAANDKALLNGEIKNISLPIPRLNQTVNASCVMINRCAALVYANTTANTSSNTGNLYIDLSALSDPFTPVGVYGSAYIANKYATIMRGSSNNNAWFSTLGGGAENVTGAQASGKPLTICMVIYTNV